MLFLLLLLLVGMVMVVMVVVLLFGISELPLYYDMKADDSWPVMIFAGKHSSNTSWTNPLSQCICKCQGMIIFHLSLKMSLQNVLSCYTKSSLVVKWLSLLTLNQPSWVRIPAREWFADVAQSVLSSSEHWIYLELVSPAYFTKREREDHGSLPSEF